MLQNDSVVYSFKGPMGVRVDIGQSIIFLMGLILVLSLNSSIVNGIVFVLILFGSIYLHELGHAWGNKVQGIPVKRILIHGGGGLCESARSGTAKQRELVVIMGPLVNLALWAVSGLLGQAMLRQILADPSGTASNDALIQIMSWVRLFGWINMLLFIFNLIPVQPLDGGKLLHLFLLRLTDPRTALRITGGVGLVAAILWIPAAIFLFMSFGFILLFFPSIRLHFAMFKGKAAF